MNMTVEEYKKHPLFPFSDFRTNDASFLLMELFWTQVAKEAIGEQLSSLAEPLSEFDRDKERFYTPTMLDFWIPSMRRGARILLSENIDNSPTIENAIGDERFQAFYPFTFSGQYRGVTGPYDEIEQIEFGSDLSDEAIKSVQNGLRAFFRDKISFQELEEMREKHRASLSNYPTKEEWDEYYDRVYPDDE